MNPLISLLAGTVLTGTVLALAGCSAAPAADDGTLRVVASTSVYGDLASTVGGDHVDVTSLITNPAVDPHGFEASARDRLAISRADLVIGNGGGYDPYVDALVSASGSTAPVLAAVEVAQLGDDNEHVWYSLPGMIRLTHAIVGELGGLDPANAAAYAANGDALVAQLEGLDSRAAALGASGDVLMTEPVPGHLLEAAGLTDVTPAAFTEAVEEGADVPPLALQQTLALVARPGVVLLAYNSATATPATERVRTAAEGAGILVVEFAETLPEGEGYVTWMTRNLDALAVAVGG